jgi:hypothetical protein
MGNCSVCGTYIANEYGMCSGCAAAAHPTDDVPCQRCGMYLPRHELQMWNSRLYCNYCLMDLRDEEQRMRDGVKREQRAEGEAPVGSGGEPLAQRDLPKICERCGRRASVLYEHHGRRLCTTCLSEEGGKPPFSSDPFGFILNAIGIGRKLEGGAAKIGSAAGEKQKIQEKSAGAEWKAGHKADGAGGEGEKEGKGKGSAGASGGKGAAGVGVSGRRFDIRTRKFVKD